MKVKVRWNGLREEQVADLVQRGELSGPFVVLEWEALVAFRARWGGKSQSLLTSAATSLVRTVRRALAGQAVLTDPEARLRVCFTCPDRKGKRCGLCGCFLAAKTRMAGERCPEGLW